MRKEDKLKGNRRKTRKDDLGLYNNKRLQSRIEAKFITNRHGNTPYPANDNIGDSIKDLHSQLKNPRGWIKSGDPTKGTLHKIPVYGILFACFKALNKSHASDAIDLWRQKYVSQFFPDVTKCRQAYYTEKVRPNQDDLFTNHLVSFAGKKWYVTLQMQFVVRVGNGLYAP